MSPPTPKRLAISACIYYFVSLFVSLLVYLFIFYSFMCLFMYLLTYLLTRLLTYFFFFFLSFSGSYFPRIHIIYSEKAPALIGSQFMSLLINLFIYLFVSLPLFLICSRGAWITHKMAAVDVPQDYNLFIRTYWERHHMRYTTTILLLLLLQFCLSIVSVCARKPLRCFPTTCHFLSVYID